MQTTANYSVSVWKKNAGLCLLVFGLFVFSLITFIPAGFSSAQSTIPSAGLVSWWPAEGNANDVKDGNSGTLMGGVTFAPGKVGQAFNLDGVDDYIELGHPANLRPSGSDFTVSGWFMIPDYPNNSPDPRCGSQYPIIGYDWGWIVGVRGGDGRIVFSKYTGYLGGESILSASPVSTNALHHFAAVHTPSEMRIYVDGVLAGTQAITTGVVYYRGAYDTLQIGQRHCGVGRWNGKGLIDELAFHNRALTASEIRAMYDDTPPETTITDGPPALTNINDATFTFVSNETGSTFECQLDGGGFAVCTSPQSYSGLGDGSHTFEVRATDPAGNVDSTPASSSWTVDATPPVITGSRAPAANASGWNNTNVVVSFTCADNAGGSGIATDTVAGGTVSAEGAGQSVTNTGSCIDNAGNVAVAATVGDINIDKTAPEAFNRFNPATLDVEVVGRDESSGVQSVILSTNAVPQDDEGDDEEEDGKAELRSYTVTDMAGNTLVLVEKVKKAGHEIKVEMISLQYNGGAVITLPKNSKKYEWSTAKDGSLKELEQKMDVGTGSGKQSVEAKFKAKTNTTAIKTEYPKPETRVVVPGLVLLRMATLDGGLTIEF